MPEIYSGESLGDGDRRLRELLNASARCIHVALQDSGRLVAGNNTFVRFSTDPEAARTLMRANGYSNEPNRREWLDMTRGVRERDRVNRLGFTRILCPPDPGTVYARWIEAVMREVNVPVGREDVRKLSREQAKQFGLVLPKYDTYVIKDEAAPNVVQVHYDADGIPVERKVFVPGQDAADAEGAAYTADVALAQRVARILHRIPVV